MSSVGQVIGGIVGAVVGFFTPVGPIVGAQIGITLGGVIDPPDGPVINGPRLDDLSVQTSTYGAFIPRNYGTVAQNGNIFWLKGDRLTETPRAEESGGKGGSTTTTNLWDYSATFALGLCEGPIDGIRRIWINGQLWYDAGSSDVSTIIASNDASLLFTLYKGTDTQLADPLIQADKGAANVPAYRGLAYIVFENLPLAKYNNSLAGAQVKVEIVKNGVVTNTLTQLGEATMAGGSFPRCIDVVGSYAYVTTQDTEYIKIFDIHDTQKPYLVGEIRTDFICHSVVVYNAKAYVINYGASNLKIYNVGDPQAPTLLKTVTTGNNPRGIAIDWPYLYIITGTNKLDIYDVAAVDATVLLGSVSTDSNPRGLALSGTYAYVTNLTANTMQIFSILSPSAPSLVGTIATGTEPYGIAVRDNYVYVTHNTSLVLNVYDVTVPSIPVLAGSATTGASLGVRLVDDWAYVMNFNGVLHMFDISTPSSPVSITSTDFGTSVYSIDAVGSVAYIVDSFLNTLRIILFAPDRITPGTVALSTIVQAECLKSTLLTAADLDVTELTDSVRGYRVSSLGALRGGLDPLRAVWPFDVVQNGYKLKFKKRGSASVVTINADELDARAAGENPGVQITNSREMDTLLPSSLRLNYIDATREYDTNEQMSDRNL